MSTLRYPSITGKTPQERVAQIEAYLHQLVDDLQFAAKQIDTGEAVVVSNQVIKNIGASPVPASSVSNTPEKTFASIKSLIIKSADIIKAYEEKMTKTFNGLYVAESDFGTFKEATASQFNASSNYVMVEFAKYATINALNGVITDLQKESEERAQSVTDASDSMQAQINGAKDELDKGIADLDRKTGNLSTRIEQYEGAVKIGWLDEAETKFGIRIGQTNSVDGVEAYRAFAVFAPDRLSFYNAEGDEVAYISNRKLYITTAEILQKIITGGYEISSTSEAGGGLTFKWVGMEESK